jgi:stage II sporulation protein E
MQYGLNLTKYKKEEKVSTIKRDLLVMLGLFFAGLLISRVVVCLDANSVEGIAPFGLAYLIAIVMQKDYRKILIATIGVLFGYISVSTVKVDIYINIINVIILIVYALIGIKIIKRIKEIEILALIFISYLVYGLIINSNQIVGNITTTIINTIIIVPVYCVIKYGTECIGEYKGNYIFSTEEIISIGILISLILCGFGEFSIFGLCFRTILAYALVLVASYVGGALYGSAIGVVLGLIVGISSGDMMTNISCFALLGLVSGIFKDTGKLINCSTYIITYMVISMYLKNITMNSFMEIIIASLIFLVVPKIILQTLKLEINLEKKKEHFNNLELNYIKEEFCEKIKGLGDGLITVANTLKILESNEILLNKEKSTALIGNLADRVCSKCCKCNQCWSRDFSTTYNSFEELILSIEEEKQFFPNQLEKICLEKLDLINAAKKLIYTFKKNEMKRKILEEGRLITASHIKSIALAVDSMLDDFKRDVILCPDLEAMVRKGLNRNAISYKSVLCYRDINARTKIKIVFEGQLGYHYDENQILLIINDVVNVPMSICSEEYKINWDNEYTLVFHETPKYQVISYGAISPKTGEECIGDTYSFGNTSDGNYITIVSDGMGSGPEAGRESAITVDVIERFLEAGFSKTTAINMVNSIMGIKFEEDEKFSTLDLNILDLYSGKLSFIKVGAVPSFIKRGKNVRTISTNMPPFGLIDQVEVEEVTSNVASGDLIITISDGILDINKESAGTSNWIEEYLVNSVRDPKQLAQNILEKAKEFNGGISKDDMTVIVSKVYSVY